MLALRSLVFSMLFYAWFVVSSVLATIISLVLPRRLPGSPGFVPYLAQHVRESAGVVRSARA